MLENTYFDIYTNVYICTRIMSGRDINTNISFCKYNYGYGN